MPDGEAERGAGLEGSGLCGEAGVTERRTGATGSACGFRMGRGLSGLPGKEATLRGFSAVSLLIIDEASRVEDAVYKALRPMLAVGDGDLWLLSTPFGKRGFFYENWAGGREDWVRVSGAGHGMLANFGEVSGRGAEGSWGMCGSGRSICANSSMTSSRCSGGTW